MPSKHRAKVTAIFARPLTDPEAGLTLPVEMHYPGPKSKKTSAEDIQRDFETQVTDDWKRNAGLTYFISGTSALLLNQGETLDTLKKVKHLFKTELLDDMRSEDQDSFFKLLIPHIHQGGLMHNSATRLSEHYCQDRQGVPGHGRLFFAGDSILFPIENGIGIIERNCLTKILTTLEDGLDIKKEEVGTKHKSPVEIVSYTSITFSPPDGIHIASPVIETNITDPRFKIFLGIQPREEDLLAMGVQAATALLTDTKKLAMSYGAGLGGWLGAFSSEPSKELVQSVSLMKETIESELSPLKISIARELEGGLGSSEENTRFTGILKKQIDAVIALRKKHPGRVNGLRAELDDLLNLETQIQLDLKKVLDKKRPVQAQRMSVLEQIDSHRQIADEKIESLKEQLQTLQEKYQRLGSEDQKAIEGDYLYTIQEIEKKQLSLITYKQALLEKSKALPRDEEIDSCIEVFKQASLSKISSIDSYASRIHQKLEGILKDKEAFDMSNILALKKQLGECELLSGQNRIALSLAENEMKVLDSEMKAFTEELEDVTSAEGAASLQKKIRSLHRSMGELNEKVNVLNAELVDLNTEAKEIGAQLTYFERENTALQSRVERLEEEVQSPDETLNMLGEKSRLEKALTITAISEDNISIRPSQVMERIEAMINRTQVPSSRFAPPE